MSAPPAGSPPTGSPPTGSPEEGAKRRGPWIPLAQGLASVLILVLLVREADVERVRAALAGADLRWVLVATLAKGVGLTLHEVRLWVSLLPWGRTSLWRVITIGWVSGLMNTILPVRGGDIIAMGLLRQELKVAGPAAVAAVGITGFMEAAVFAVFLLGVILLGASQWELMLGVAQTRNALGAATILTLGAVFGSVGVVLVGRRLRQDAPEEPGPGVLSLIRETVVRTGEGLSAWGPVAWNVILSALQVVAVVLSFWALLPALHLEIPLSLLAVSGVIAMGSLAAVVLPPSLGAGPAASAVLVLGFFGVTEAQALGFAALSWLANTTPAVVLGLGPLLQRLERLGQLLRRESDASESP